MISKEKLLEDTMKVKKPSKKMIAALAVVIAGISIASYFEKEKTRQPVSCQISKENSSVVYARQESVKS